MISRPIQFLRTMFPKSKSSNPLNWYRQLLHVLILVIPFLFFAYVFFSSLIFFPVPWPDDSAFYFVAKDLMTWPSKWIVSSQSPFVPSYDIFNFNMMPLYPILIGIGRWFGIDGYHYIKFWPLLFLAFFCFFLAQFVWTETRNLFLTLLFVLTSTLNPNLKWASVVVRPESLIGLLGLLIAIDIRQWIRSAYVSNPIRFRGKPLFERVSLYLAIAAYAHFNAIHLVFIFFPVFIALLVQGGQTGKIGFRYFRKIATETSALLFPWVLSVCIYPVLFIEQMSIQWQRLSFRNQWLDSLSNLLVSFFPSLGHFISWPQELLQVSLVLIFLILVSIFVFVIILKSAIQLNRSSSKTNEKFYLLPFIGWVWGAIWVWHSKPELWFTSYLHFSISAFAAAGVIHLKDIKVAKIFSTALLIFCVTRFGQALGSQIRFANQNESFAHRKYIDFVDCIDRVLMRESESRGIPTSTPSVWVPSWPDVTIELSNRHPKWAFTRTCDFPDQYPLAVKHGYAVDFVVIPEALSRKTDDQDLAISQFDPNHRSRWMKWPNYYLNQLEKDPNFKPHRHFCQKGMWQAYIYW